MSETVARCLFSVGECCCSLAVGRYLGAKLSNCKQSQVAVFMVIYIYIYTVLARALTLFNYFFESRDPVRECILNERRHKTLQTLY